MRILVVGILIIINIILESTIFQYLRIFGVKPDFIIIIMVSYAIMRGSSYGAFIGLGSGLLFDMLYGRAIGINALSYMITGYIIGQAHENVFKDSFIPAVIFNIGAVFIQQNLCFLATYFSNNFGENGVSYVYILVKTIIPLCLYNGLVGGILYRYIYKLDEKKFMEKRIY